MEKGSDQTTNEWQGQLYRDETIHLGKIDRYAKEGVTFLSCCLSLFIFWTIMNHAIFIILELHATDWSQLPQVMKIVPHKKLMICATIIAGSSALISSILKKVQSSKSNFPLIKLFSKKSTRRPLKSSRSFHHD